LTSTSRRPWWATARSTSRAGPSGAARSGHADDPVDAVEGVGVPRAGDDVGAFVRQRAGHREADPLAGAGDDGDLAGELQVHAVAPLLPVVAGVM
jgi:hypothetical protein